MHLLDLQYVAGTNLDLNFKYCESCARIPLIGKNTVIKSLLAGNQLGGYWKSVLVILGLKSAIFHKKKIWLLVKGL